MITIKQIAEEAGVSTATVSNVMNGNHARVSKETAEKVRSIIEKHGYHPNLVARGLIAKETKIIAVLLPARFREDLNLLEDTYNQQIVGLLEVTLNRLGYYMMLRSFSSPDEILAFFRNWNVDGAVMFYPFFEERLIQEILAFQKPVVLLDRHYPNLQTLSVDLDDYGGGYTAAAHFVQNGHRNVGFAGPVMTKADVIMNRLKGFQDGLRENGICLPEENIFSCPTPYAFGLVEGKKIAKLANRPTAIFATMDTLAIGIMEGLKESGIRVPDDVSLIGFDNWMGCDMVSPKLTTISQNLAEKVKDAVDILMRAIREPKYRSEHITLGTELIIRSSVADLNQ